MHLGTFTVTALDVKAYDSAAHVRVTVSLMPTATNRGPPRREHDLNQAALMALWTASTTGC